MPALPPNSLIVITGITGYIASHVGLAALQSGHRVRGTVRSLTKAASLKAAYSKAGVDISPYRLAFVIVDDLTSQAQYEAAFKGADGIAHVALPDFTAPNLLEKTMDSVFTALRAASKEPTIKRFVLTSTAMAAYSPPQVVDHALTGEDWNWTAVKQYENATADEKSHPFFVWTEYAAAKVLSEQAAFKFVKDEKTSFDLVSILPFANFGPVLYGEVGSTAGWIAGLLKNDDSSAKMIPPQWYIDVRDDGRLHVLALTVESASNQRIWGAAAPYGWNKVLAILRKNFPTVKVPEDLPTGVESPQAIDNSVATEMLGRWNSLEDAVVDTAKSLGYYII